MFAIPFAIIVFGYWVMWAGVKQSTLLDAWNCKPETKQTPVSEPGAVSVTVPGPAGPVTGVISTDCTIKSGDTKIPLPGNHYLLWRPIGSGFLGQLNGQIIGPC